MTAIDFSACSKMQIRFNVIDILTCNGEDYTKEDVIYEIAEIIKKKSWILPDWSVCDSNGNEVCLEGKGLEDIHRRLQAVYFRFGWKNPKGKLIGIGPYCLEALEKSGESIVTGVLHPKDANVSLKRIEFYTSNNKDDYFNIALYGMESLLDRDRRMINTLTPLGYYIISNKIFSRFKSPWNTEGAITLIRKHMFQNSMLQSESIFSLNSFLPKGRAKEHNASLKKTLTSSQTLMIPDYFPDCNNLAKKLTDYFERSGYVGYNAECKDLVKFHAEYIIGRKKNQFSAFITPLSPGAPSRKGIIYQYFSDQSSESFTGDFHEPELLFQRIGIGPSNVVLDGKKYCDLTINGMGMSNIMIEDFREC